MKYTFDSVEKDNNFSNIYTDVGSFFLDLEGYFYCINTTGLVYLENFLQNSQAQSKEIKLFKGYYFQDIMPEEQWQVFSEHIQRCTTAKEDVITELTLGRGDKKYQVQLLSSTSFNCRFLEKEGYYSTLIDITKYKQLHEVISWLEQINVVGKIASSVAHEVRNPLTVVRGHIQLMSWDESLQKHKEQLEIMQSEIDRAVEILTEFLHLTKPSTFKLERQNINDILKNLWQLLNAEAIVNMHDLEYHLSEIPDVLLDKKRFRQVVLNLVKNGLQAMERYGKISVKTYYQSGKVYFAVTDNGPGIPPAVLKELGRPFFTTKKTGTGLGLSACFNIIKQHNAKMEVDTGAGGTTFIIIFDALEEKISDPV